MSFSDFLNYGIAGLALYLLYKFLNKIDTLTNEIRDLKEYIKEICRRGGGV